MLFIQRKHKFFQNGASFLILAESKKKGIQYCPSIVCSVPVARQI